MLLLVGRNKKRKYERKGKKDELKGMSSEIYGGIQSIGHL
jgi:hypothetical protein